MDVEGSCAPGFERVRDEFARNFTERGEVGASFSVFLDGEPVVDLWGGLARRADRAQWSRDTLVPMMSVNKAMAATCVHLLVRDGSLDLDAPMAQYWPGFGQAGKERITVAQVLAHRSGVLFLEGLRRGELFDHEKVVAAIEAQRPYWPGASRGAYHSSTFGPMLAELVRRVTGEDLGAFFDRRVNELLGTDYRFRLDDAQLARTAELIERPFNVLRTLVLDAPYSYRMLRAWWALPPLGPRGFGSPTFLQSGFASGAGAGNARSVAHIFGALARGSAGRLLDAGLLARATAPSWTARCWLSGIPTRMALGYALNAPGGAFFGPNERSFGHAGRGGAFGFGDPDRRLGVGYAANRLTSTGVPDERSQRLVAAVYDASSALSATPIAR